MFKIVLLLNLLLTILNTNAQVSITCNGDDLGPVTGPGDSCCSIRDSSISTPYYTSTQICCNGNVFNKTDGNACCDSAAYVNTMQVCCSNELGSIISDGDSCCSDENGNSVAYISSSSLCCNGRIVGKDQYSSCCAIPGFTSSTIKCCGSSTCTTTSVYSTDSQNSISNGNRPYAPFLAILTICIFSYILN